MNKRSPKISRLGNILSMIPAKTSGMWIPIILIIIVLFTKAETGQRLREYRTRKVDILTHILTHLTQWSITAVTDSNVRSDRWFCYTLSLHKSEMTEYYKNDKICNQTVYKQLILINFWGSVPNSRHTSSTQTHRHTDTHTHTHTDTQTHTHTHTYT